MKARHLMGALIIFGTGYACQSCYEKPAEILKRYTTMSSEERDQIDRQRIRDRWAKKERHRMEPYAEQVNLDPAIIQYGIGDDNGACGQLYIDGQGLYKLIQGPKLEKIVDEN